VRYGVNISNWQRPEKGGWAWCYSADAVNLAKGERPAVFYAYEWINPRLGKTIREVRLKGTDGFKNWQGQPGAPNGIVLAAVSIVKKRSYPDPVRATSAEK
jgi:hypothetical protein